MILITVGTTPFNFDRLLKHIDKLIETKKIRETVVMQIGNSNYKPKNAKWFRSKSYNDIRKLNRKANIVITHGGAGSILTALEYNKPVICVPRLKRFDEHSDDHQIDLVKTLSDQNKIIGVFKIEDLYKSISKIKRIRKLKETRNLLSTEIKKYLKKYERNSQCFL